MDKYARNYFNTNYFNTNIMKIFNLRPPRLLPGLIILMIVAFGNCGKSGMNKSGLNLVQNDSIIEIDNGMVKGLFRLNSPNISQSFYAAGNGEWILIAQSLEKKGESGSGFPKLYSQGSEYADEFRLMANEGLKSVEIMEETDERISILFTGDIGNNKISQKLTLSPGQDHFHFEVSASLPGDPPKLEYLLSSFLFIPEGEPDFTLVPQVKRSDEDVVGDRKFFAPVSLVEKDGLMMALVPDLDMINKNIIYAKGARPQKHPRIFAIPIDTANISLPTALDLNVNPGIMDKTVISYGFIDYWVEQHVYWRHENENGVQVRELSDNNLSYGFDLFLKSDVVKYRGYQQISAFLWERYGTKYLRLPRPQAMPYSEYAKISYPASFAYEGYDIIYPPTFTHKDSYVTDGPTLNHRSGDPKMETWQQWETDGVPVGGLRLSAPQWYDLIYNTSWWNNVCDATGIYYWGRSLGDSSLLDKARRIINFTLSAPQNEGIFPGLYDVKKGSWMLSLWNPPHEEYDPDKVDSYWSFNKNDGAYQTSSASVTAGFLMQYRKDCEDNPGILPYVTRYGDFLIRNMQANGCVPGWFNDSLKTLPSLFWNADGGAHIWVLSELFRATGETKYMDAAEKMAEFMINEVMPKHKWYDFETFYSCAVKSETFYDPRTAQYPANNMSVSWALEGFASLYEISLNSEYLAAAEAIADYSIFYQAIWAPHFIVTAYPFGGVSSQNSDAEWLDQRSHRFVNPLIRIGLLTGRQDLLERAVAAGRASLTLVNNPLHVKNNIYKFPNFPLGLGPENIDHEGFPQMPLRSGPSWCEVGGLAAAANLLRQLGGIYINFEKNIAVGIDGVAVDSYRVKGKEIRINIRSLLSELPETFENPFTINMRIGGLKDLKYNFIINDGPVVEIPFKEFHELKVNVTPDGHFLY